LSQLDALFSGLTLDNVQGEVIRNIVSLAHAQDLFDDLTDDPAEWAMAQSVEIGTKPPPYLSPLPVIDRPFEDAEWFNAIDWPFKHWQASRFSTGSYGVWYGSDSIETTVYESAYHWHRGFLADAGFDHETVIAERKVYAVACHAAVLDLRPTVRAYPDLLHATDYAFCQAVGARIHREGHPGLHIQSVRRPDGDNLAIFNPKVLSAPRVLCFLTYRLEGGRVVVEREPGRAWIELE
jgi:hypothetical protein